MFWTERSTVFLCILHIYVITLTMGLNMIAIAYKRRKMLKIVTTNLPNDTCSGKLTYFGQELFDETKSL